ncbi:MAG: hypothetical protein JWO72_1581 [Caulobacteraceae bacterium]|nr:hypothetical protein [Caulobacteraceae bacterium]
MADVVVKLPVREGEEAQLFGVVLNSFIESRSSDAELWAATSDAPYLMVRSDPQPDVEMKTLIFQEDGAARDFSHQWAKARIGLTAKVTYQLG